MNSRLYRTILGPAAVILFSGALALGGCNRSSEGRSQRQRSSYSQRHGGQGSSGYTTGTTGTGAQEGAQASSRHQGGSQPSQSQGGSSSQLQSGSQATAATASIQPVSGSQLSGTFQFRQEANGVRVISDVRGLPAGAHQVHIASAASCPMSSSQQQGQRGQLGSQQQMHVAIGSIQGQAGQPESRNQWTVQQVSLKGPNSVVGKSVLILGSAAGAGGQQGQQGQQGQMSVLACGLIQPAGQGSSAGK